MLPVRRCRFCRAIALEPEPLASLLRRAVCAVDLADDRPHRREAAVRLVADGECQTGRPIVHVVYAAFILAAARSALKNAPSWSQDAAQCIRGIVRW